MSLDGSNYLNRRKSTYKCFFEAQRKKNNVMKLLLVRPYNSNSIPKTFINLILTVEKLDQ